jgi:hypothetical protein
MATESTSLVRVGIPWRHHPSRERAFDHTVSFYEGLGFPIVTHDSGHAVFNLAATRNQLVREHLGDGLVILSDADTVPEERALTAALTGALADELVHLPYHLYRDENHKFTPGATSGIYVFRPEAWEATNGQDERFEGWGYEDAAWRLAHLTLAGPIPRHHGTAVAAVHDIAPRDRVTANRERFRMYQAAYGNVEAMTVLINGGHYLSNKPPTTIRKGWSQPAGRP